MVLTNGSLMKVESIAECSFMQIIGISGPMSVDYKQEILLTASSGGPGNILSSGSSRSCLHCIHLVGTLEILDLLASSFSAFGLRSLVTVVILQILNTW